MKLQEVTIREYKSAQLLNESWQVLTERQQVYLGRWETQVWPLMEQLSVLLEAELTADQIQQIFQNAEEVTVDNKTALGKTGAATAQVTSKMKDEIVKLAKAAQETGPIQNIDAQFDKLRSQIANKVSSMPGGKKILAGVDAWKEYSKSNPAKSAFIIGAMTLILGFASAGMVSGGVIGLFLRMANSTLQGDKLSTAVGKGLKGAAIGAIAGAIGNVVLDGFDIDPTGVEGEADFSVDADLSDIDLSQVGEDQFRQMFANNLADEQFAKWGDMGSMNDAMLEKLADNVTIEGNYPDDFTASIEGKIVQGNTFLTPDEVAEYDRIVQSNGGGMQGSFSKEAQDYVNDIRGEGPTGVNQVPDGGTDPETGANEPQADAVTTGKNYPTEQAAKAAAERAEGWPRGVSDRAVVDNGDGTFSVLEKNPDNLKSVKDTFSSSTDTETGAEPEADPRQGADWNELEDFEKAYELRMNVDAEDWTPEDFDIVKADGDMNPRQAAEYFGVRPDAVKDAIGNDTFEVENFLKQMIGNDAWENASRQDKQWAIDWLTTNAFGKPTGESLDEQLWDELELYEAGIMSMASKAADAIGKVASKGAEKAGQGIKAVGKELGQQVTAGKLNRIWKKMGSPTDTASVVNVLSQAGLSDEQIGTVGSNNNVDLKKTQAGQSTAQVDVQTLAAEIKKLGIAAQVKQMLIPKRKASPTS